MLHFGDNLSANNIISRHIYFIALPLIFVSPITANFVDYSVPSAVAFENNFLTSPSPDSTNELVFLDKDEKVKLLSRFFFLLALFLFDGSIRRINIVIDGVDCVITIR